MNALQVALVAIVAVGFITGAVGFILTLLSTDKEHDNLAIPGLTTMATGAMLFSGGIVTYILTNPQ